MMAFAGLIILGGVTVLLYNQQVLIANYLNELGFKVAVVGQAKPDGLQVQETRISGMYLGYVPCKAGYTGACDDAAVYRESEDGSKQVILPSVRGLAGAPLTGELLQPLSQSQDGKYLVMGAWSYGSERGANDRRIWIYDLQNASLYAKADVPLDAVFSPDYTYAAYGGFSEGDIRDLMVVNLRENRTVSGAKAGERRTFVGPENRVSIRWIDSKNLAVKEYSKPTQEAPVPVEKGEISIKLK